MKIGNIDLGPRPVLLAPMEDVTDIGFRLLCRRLGAAMVYSEFVCADALVRMVNKSLMKLTVCDEERPVVIQTYGKDPGAVAEAAEIILEQAHPDIIDINFGCPVKKGAGKGAGAGLLQNIPLMLEIARAVVDRVGDRVPVTCKTRLAWNAETMFVSPDGELTDARSLRGVHVAGSQQVREVQGAGGSPLNGADNLLDAGYRYFISDLAERLQDQGISALTIHGRTRSQMYTGEADWRPIAAVKANPRIHIPIIGNGDIDSAEKCARAFDETGVDAVMIGRATFGRPWIFKEIAEPGCVLTPDWKLDVLKQQALESIRLITSQDDAAKRSKDTSPEYRGILHVRRHLAASPLFKGIPNFRDTRIRMLRADTLSELFDIMEEVRPLVSALNN